MKIIKLFVILCCLAFFWPGMALSMVEANMEEVKFEQAGYGGMAAFDKGVWKIGDFPDFDRLAEFESERGPLRIFAVDGIGVLFLNDGSPVGERARCYTVPDLDRILKEREDKEKRRKMLEREAFFNEKSV